MEAKTTGDLNDILKNNRDIDIDAYSRLLEKQPYHDYVSYMDYLIAEKKLTRKAIFQRADLPVKYGYKLLTEEARTSDRDKLLRIFIAMEMTVDECCRALNYYGLAPLYPRIKRDTIIILELHQQHGSVDTVNERLIEAGEEPLSASSV